MKKFSVALLFIALLVQGVSSADLEDVIARAKAQSGYYANLRGSANLSDFEALLKQLDKQDTYELGINASLTPDSPSGNSSIRLNPSFSYSSGSEDTTRITLSAPMNIVYSSPLNTVSTYAPDLSVSQKLRIDAVSDNSSDYAKRRARLQANSLAEKIDYQFEISVCDSLSKVLEKESALLTAKASFGKSKAEFDSSVASGLITEGTYAYNQKASAITGSEKSLRKCEYEYDTALANFKRLCGFEYEDLDVFTVPDFDFTALEQGNTTVAIALLDKLSAENNYAILMKNDGRALNFDASASLNIEDSEVSGYAFDGSVGYSDSSWQVKAGAGVDIDAVLKKNYPEFTLSAKYNIGSSVSQTEKLNRQKALINMQSKSYDYDLALYNYRSDAMAMASNILAARIELEKWKMDYDNVRIGYANEKRLYENGYYSELEFNEKTASFAKTENDYKIFLLSLRKLQCEARILNC